MNKSKPVQISEENFSDKLQISHTHHLLNAQGKTHVFNAQIRLFIKPIVRKLVQRLGSKKEVEERLKVILESLQRDSQMGKFKFGYAPANLLHILHYLDVNLQAYNFSGLTYRRANLQDMRLIDTDFAWSEFDDCRFIGDFKSILTVAFDPTGRLMVTGDSQNTVRIWEIESGRQLQKFEGHNAWVQCAVFNPVDPRILASGSEDHDNNIILWQWKPEESNYKYIDLEGHQLRTRSLVFSHDGKRLISCGDDGLIKVWDLTVDRPVCIQRLTEHKNRVMAVAINRDGSLLASGSGDCTIKLWRMGDQKSENTLTGHNNEINAVAFSPDGKTLASGSVDTTVRLWDNATRSFQILEGHQDAVTSLSFREPDGRRLASASLDSTIRIWDPVKGECTQMIHEHEMEVSALSYCPNAGTGATNHRGQKRDILASGGRDNTARVWCIYDTNRYDCLQTFKGYDASVISVSFSPQQKLLASGSQNRSITLWDVSNPRDIQCRKRFNVHAARVNFVEFSPDGKYLASGSDDRTLQILDLQKGVWLPKFKEHRGVLPTVTFDPSGSLIASSSHDATVKLWRIEDRTCLVTIKHPTIVRAVAFRPQFNHQFATGCDDRTLRLWDYSGNQECARLNAHDSWITTVVFSPDGKKLFSGGDDGTVCVWDLESGDFEKFGKHDEGIRRIAINSSGNLLASASNDRSIKIWDIDKKELVHNLIGHIRWVWDVAFDYEGGILASCSEDESIRLWDLASGDCLAAFRSAGPYEEMNILHVDGLSEAQKATLKNLGAVAENQEPQSRSVSIISAVKCPHNT